MFKRTHFGKWAMLLGLLWTLGACSGGGSGGDGNQNDTNPNNDTTEPVLTHITVDPANADIMIQSTEQLKATAHYDTGMTTDLTQVVVWSSDNNAVAEVDVQSNKGLVTGRSAGVAHIKAELTQQGLSATATVNVSVQPQTNPLTGLTIQPNNIPNNELLPGLSRQLIAVGVYQDLSEANLTNDVEWVSSDEEVATVDTGDFKGALSTLTTGETTITITHPASGLQATYDLTVADEVMIDVGFKPVRVYYHFDGKDRLVMQLGTTQPMKAFAEFTGPSEIEITNRVNWFAETTEIIEVSNAPGSKGRVTALAPGNGIVRVEDPVTNFTKRVGITIYPKAGLTSGDMVFSDTQWRRLVMYDAETALKMPVPFEIDDFRSMDFDNNGLLYTVDTRLNGILEIDVQNQTQDLVARGWYLDQPWAAIKDTAGNYYVVDRGVNGIIKIDTNKSQSLLSVDGFFQELTDITLEDPVNGPLLVTDEGASAVIRVNKDTGEQNVVSSAGDLQQPSAIAVADNGDIYVTDTGSEKLLTIDPADGGQSTFASGLVDNPTDLALAANGSVYVATQGVIFGTNQTDGGLRSISPAGVVSNPIVVLQNGLFGVAIGSDQSIYFGNPHVNTPGYEALIGRLVSAIPRFEVVVSGRGSTGPGDIVYTSGDELIVSQWGGADFSRVDTATAKRTPLCCDYGDRTPPVPMVSALAKGNDGNILFAQSWADWGVYEFDLLEETVVPVSTGGLLTGVYGDYRTSSLSDMAVSADTGDIYVGINLPANGQPALVRINGVDSSQFGYNVNCANGLCDVSNVVIEDSNHLLVNDVVTGFYRLTDAALANDVVLDYLFGGNDAYQDMEVTGENELTVLYSNVSGNNTSLNTVDLTDPEAPPGVISTFENRSGLSFIIVP